MVDEASDGTSLREGVESLEEIVLEELNVKELAFGEAEDVFVYDLKPDLGVVGPKYGRLVPGIRAALAGAPAEVGVRAAAGEGVTVDVEGEEITLSSEELLVEPKAEGGLRPGARGDPLRRPQHDARRGSAGRGVWSGSSSTGCRTSGARRASR